MTSPSTHHEPRPSSTTEPFGPGRLDRAELVALASACGAPRVSIFWPVGPYAAEVSPQERIAKLVRDAEAELSRRGVGSDETAAILGPARAVSSSAGLSQLLGGSLGILASASEARLFVLPQTVEPRAWVSGRYRVSPLATLVEDDGAGELRAHHRLAMALASGRVRLDLPTVLVQARAGRLELLLCALEARAFGTFDADGRVELHATPEPDDEELVDLAFAYALGHGAEVHVARGDRIVGLPGASMVAALLRP